MNDAMEGDRMQRVPLGRNPCGQALILVVLSLMGLGVVMVASTAAGRRRPTSQPIAAAQPPGETVQAAAERPKWYYRRDLRQGMFAAAAAVILLTLWRVDYRLFARRRWLTWTLLGVAVASSTRLAGDQLLAVPLPLPEP